MKKKLVLIAATLLVAAVCAGVFAACGNPDYFDDLNAYGFWDNRPSQAIAQPKIGQMVRDFLSSPLPEGKNAKKVAFIGYDGCRADALINVLDTPDEIGGDNSTSKYSAIAEVLKGEEAGIYYAYAGGEKGRDNEQHTSTAPGWAALTTGVWGVENGITDNGMPKKIEHKTFMLEAAEGTYGNTEYRTTFAASWLAHFNENYMDEIEYLREHSSSPVAKTELSGADADTVTQYLDEIAKSADISMRHKYVKNDEELHEYLLSCVEEGGENERDIIFGIYEGTDHNGHSTGFGNDNYKYIKGFRDEDAMAYELLQAIYSRPSYESEDWLIVITTDHGGYKTWHGNQTYEERSTWIVCNKGMDEKYFGSGYDGHTEN